MPKHQAREGHSPRSNRSSNELLSGGALYLWANRGSNGHFRSQVFWLRPRGGYRGNCSLCNHLAMTNFVANGKCNLNLMVCAILMFIDFRDLQSQYFLDKKKWTRIISEILVRTKTNSFWDIHLHACDVILSKPCGVMMCSKEIVLVPRPVHSCCSFSSLVWQSLLDSRFRISNSLQLMIFRMR